MQTDFTSYWQQATEEFAELADPEFVFILNAAGMKLLAQKAFEAGVIHTARVTRDLSRMAREEQLDKMLGPESLRPEFEQIFGPNPRVT